MINSSSQNPEPSEPSSISQEELQRIRRQALNSTMDEWIAVIVAFGTIGAILFWSFGGTKSNFAPLSGSSFLSSSRQTTETKADKNLDAQPLSSRENFNDLNITDSSDDVQSEGILDSGRSSLGKDNLKQKNLPFYSVPPIASVPSVTKAAIPKPVPEEVMTDLEAETEVVITEPKSEPEVVVTESESEVENLEIAFSDVTEQYWAYPFISKLAAEKLIPDAESFEPDAPITRAGMASLISQAFKDLPSIQTTKDFKDISSDNNLVADINKAVEIGFLKGYSDEKFSPDQEIPRYQVLVALATGLNLEPSDDSGTILQNFTDSENLPEWSLDKVAAATEAGLAMNRPGFELTSLNPNEPATRAEVAAMIYQTLAKLGKVPPIESQYIVPTP